MCRLGPLTRTLSLDDATYSALLDYLRSEHSPIQAATEIVSDLTVAPTLDQTPLPHYLSAAATASIRGYTVESTPTDIRRRDSSIVQARTDDGRSRICRIASLIKVELDVMSAYTASCELAIVEWAIPAALEGPGTEKAVELERDPDAYEPVSRSSFIPLNRIQARCVYAPGRVAGRPVTWAITMER